MKDEEPEIDLDPDGEDEAGAPAVSASSGSTPSRGRRNLRVMAYATLVAVPVGGLVALWLGAQPLVSSLLEKQLPSHQAAASETLGAPVRLRRLDVRLAWPVPEIRIEGIEVDDPEDRTPAAQVGWANVSLDLLASVRARAVRFGGITLGDVTLAVRERGPGRWSLEILRRLRARVLADGAPSAGGWVVPEVELRVETLRADIRPWEAPATALALTALRARVLRGGAVDLELTELRPVEGAGAPWVSLSLSSARARLSFGAAGSWAIKNARIADGPLALEGEWRSEAGRHEGRARLGGGELKAWLARTGPGVLGQSLHAWLARALRAGSIARAELEFSNGPEAWNGLSSLALKVEGVELDYQAGWPLLTGLAGDLSLKGKELSFQADSAQASGGAVTVSGIRGRSADLSAEKPEMEVEARVEAQAQAVREFLESGPFRDDALPVLRQLEPSGVSRFALALRIPLGGEDPVVGGFTFDDTRMKVHSLATEIESLAGKVEFSSSAFEFREFNGRLHGKPTEFSGRWTRGGAEGKGARAEFQGRAEFPVASIARFAPHWPVEDLFAGVVAVGAQVSFDDGLWRAKGSTRLAGVTAGFPPPLYKEAHQEVEVTGELNWTEAGALKALRARWSDAPMRAKDAPPTEIELVAEPEKGATVSGKLAQLPVELWSDFAKRLAERATPPEGATRLEARLWADEILWRHERFVGSRIRLSRETLADGGTAHAKGEFSIDSFDLKGVVRWQEPLPKHTLRAEFDRVRLSMYPWQLPEGAPEEPEHSDDEPGWELAAWPSLSLRLKGLRVGPQELGTLTAELRQTGAALVADHFLLAGPELEARITRMESRYSPEKPARTELDGDMRIRKSRFPMRMDQFKAAELEQARFGFRGAWDGGPDRFALKRLRGELTGAIGHGTLHEVQSGAFRLFNALSLKVEDTRKGLAEFWKGKLKLEFKEGDIAFNLFRALFGTVYLRVEGTTDARARKHDLEACIRIFTQDVEEGAPEPGCTLRKAIRGPWKEPKV
ncbi:MAG: hypothetical protein IT285_12800 [Bdellovibrionales bacterium]|nr:hypothetical protein [Bdellovibrionales bacterium]